jgi:peptidoglycan/LPS O-acetylase OafA/YrhL
MSVSQNPGNVTATTSTPVIVTERSVTALRWYMRIAGGLLLLFMMIPGDPESNSLFSYIANHGLYIVPALAAIVGSFGRRVNWLLGVVLTLMWCILDYIFIFGGPNGPGLVFEIVGAVIAVIGIIIAVLSYRAFARDF